MKNTMTIKQLRSLLMESDGKDWCVVSFGGSIGKKHKYYCRYGTCSIESDNLTRDDAKEEAKESRKYLTSTDKYYGITYRALPRSDVKENRPITEEDSEERNPPLSICDRCGRMFNDVNAEIIDGDVLCPKCAKDGGKIEKHGFGFDKDGRPRMYSEAHGDKNNRGWRKNKGTVKKESEAYRWGDLKRKLQNGISNDSITVEDDE